VIEILPVPDMEVPIDEIMTKAKGNHIEAVRLAAQWGYQLACKDTTLFKEK
jgi:hypothetical protein